MMNSTPVVFNAASGGKPVASGNAAPGEADSPPFAEALDQAEARQRAAGEGEATPDDAAQATAGETRDAAGARQAAARKAARRDGVADAPAGQRAAAAAEPASRTEVQPEEAEQHTQDRADQELVDLSAMLSAWPTQQATSAGAAAKAAPATDAASLPNAAAGSAGAAAMPLQAVGPERGRDGATRRPAGPDLAALATAAAAAQATLQARPGVQAMTQALGELSHALRAQGAGDGSAGGVLPLAMPATSAAARAQDAALPFQAELHAALGSSEFAPALGRQLSVLVRDGVEHAQLKLNPAEMGPIEVRIRLDGSQAQVDFSASQASTRQALQDAVPALASALRDSGLTLTGGGVFDQPREPRGEARQDARPSGAGTSQRASDSAILGASPPRMPRARGVVDLYA